MCIWNHYHFLLSIKSLVKQAMLVYSLSWLFTKKKSVSFRGSKSWKYTRSMFILSTPELPKQKFVYPLLTSKVNSFSVYIQVTLEILEEESIQSHLRDLSQDL